VSVMLEALLDAFITFGDAPGAALPLNCIA
jgi:hypothetical protein